MELAEEMLSRYKMELAKPQHLNFSFLVDILIKWQGVLGDCWLLSTCAALAKKEELLFRVIDPKQVPLSLSATRLCQVGVGVVVQFIISNSDGVERSDSQFFKAMEWRWLFFSNDGMAMVFENSHHHY